MNALPLMAKAAAMFRARLGAEPGCKALPLPDAVPHVESTALLWDNVLLRSDTFRRAHIETFDVAERLSVLHVCVLPHLDDPSPIFGFDMIAGPSRVTGIFLDLSPVTHLTPVPRLREVVGASALAGFAMPRSLPAWGGIFSDDMLAIRPVSLDEVSRAIGLAEVALDGVLKASGSPADPAPVNVAAGQAGYMTAQRRNEHTFRMLAGFIGMEPARRFIDEVLFPLDPNMTIANGVSVDAM
jgi:phycocyanobilin:ferredoxin oxidoreductase